MCLLQIYPLCCTQVYRKVENTLYLFNILRIYIFVCIYYYSNNNNFLFLLDRDKLHKPHLKQEVSCALEGLAVHLQPTIERFEEELCKLMSEDRANRERRPQESLSINVEERRLHVSTILIATIRNKIIYILNSQ